MKTDAHKVSQTRGTNLTNISEELHTRLEKVIRPLVRVSHELVVVVCGILQSRSVSYHLSPNELYFPLKAVSVPGSSSPYLGELPDRPTNTGVPFASLGLSPNWCGTPSAQPCEGNFGHPHMWVSLHKSPHMWGFAKLSWHQVSGN